MHQTHYAQHLEKAFQTYQGTFCKLAPGECVSLEGRRCQICYASRLAYDQEITLKQQALQAFWHEEIQGVPIEPLIPSPQGRAYRTNSKRRVFLTKYTLLLALMETLPTGKLNPLAVLHCLIEPDIHKHIYEMLTDKLQKPYARILKQALRFVIIKGNYTEQTLILNVNDINKSVLKATNTLSQSLTHQIPSINSVFLYEDRSNSPYYLGAHDPNKHPTIRKVYGKSEIFARICDKNFLYHPLAFSQVNLSILESMIQQAGSLLGLNSSTFLYDLYCGYGVFSLALAEEFKGALGVELSSASIDSAIANARRHHIEHIRFLRANINAELIEHIMQKATSNDAVLLDPPRLGVNAGVIEAIAASGPGRILHIFCNAEKIRDDLARWRACGYAPTVAVPFDAFPGTATLEVMILLQRERSP